MKKKTYDKLRIIQLILPDVLSAYAILDTAFGWNTMPIVAKLVPLAVSIIGHVLKYNSDEYFSTRSIVNKLVPDETEEKSE